MRKRKKEKNCICNYSMAKEKWK